MIADAAVFSVKQRVGPMGPIRKFPDIGQHLLFIGKLCIFTCAGIQVFYFLKLKLDQVDFFRAMALQILPFANLV